MDFADTPQHQSDSNQAITKAQYYTIDHKAAARKQLNSMSATELDADWKLLDFFGTIYVINLPEATERLHKVTAALNQIGAKTFSILPATNGRKDVDVSIWQKLDHNWAHIDCSTPGGQAAFDRQRQGEAGCYISHLRVIEAVKGKFDRANRALTKAKKSKNKDAIRAAEARVRKYSSVLILEDDNGFGIVGADHRSASLKGVGTIFRKAMLELPKDWDLLYFMSMSKRRPSPYSAHLVRLNESLCLNAYAVNCKMYDTIIKQLKKIYDPNIAHVRAVDTELGFLHGSYKCYSIKPAIGYQREGVSSITSAQHETFRQPRI